MAFRKKFRIVFFISLTFCELVDANGFGKFERMFPSHGKYSGSTCGNVAKVNAHMESTTKHETSDPVTTKRPTAQGSWIPEPTTDLSKNYMSTTNRSKFFQLTSKPTTGHSTFKPPTAVQLTQVNQTQPITTTQTVQTTLISEPTTYSPKNGKFSTDQSETLHSTTKPTTDRLNTNHLISGPPTTVQLTDLSQKQPIATPQATVQTPLISELDTDQPNHEQSTFEQLKTLQLTEVTTKQLASTQTTTPPCARNMVWGPTCNCERKCQDPTSCNCTGPETCVCPDGFLMKNTECVPEQESGCYYNEGEFVIRDGCTYVNDNCSETCTCSKNQLSCNSAYACSPNATCRERDGVRQCYCNDGYLGDGENCDLYKDCYDAYQAGHRRDDVFTILPYGWPRSPFSVWCDMTTSGGGWTMIQRRLYRNQSFKWGWKNYKYGFGSISADHWLGNENIFYLTNQQNYTLRIDLVPSNNLVTYQEYSLFRIANESDKYRLIDLGNSSGTAGDGMEVSLGRQFSTTDEDHDGCPVLPCSLEHGYSGWWYSNEWCDKCCISNILTCFYQSSNCYKRCTKGNLNGDYTATHVYKDIFWNRVYNITSTEMKIRPAN